jgi:twitching motility protein PilT
MQVGEMEGKLIKYLRHMAKVGGSDLHMKSTAIVRARIRGSLEKIGNIAFSAEQMDQLAREIVSKEQYEKLIEDRSLDFTFVIGKEARFRVNLFYQLDGLSGVFRIIPVEIPSLAKLNLPPVMHDFTDIHRGLVLVTGVTGSGKSTTLAAILNEINEIKSDHIITIEDPVEFIHEDKGCLVNQRGVGQDTKSFGDALRGALREDPDIILVGEMRDLETIDIGIHAANTGHLVFSTLHTIDAKETIDRIIGMFPGEEQNRVRMSLASVLEGVISQRLVKTIDGGRAAAIEILKKTGRIEQLIMEGRDSEIIDAIEEGKDIYGTQSFDQALLDLYTQKRISVEVLMENATSPSDMKLKLDGVGKGSVARDDVQDEEPEFFDFKEIDDE